MAKKCQIFFYLNRDDFRIWDFEHCVQEQLLKDRSQASSSGLLLDGETGDAVQSVSTECQLDLKVEKQNVR